MTFTDKYVASLKATGKKYYVREGRGFAIRVMPSGSKTFLYIYTLGGIKRYLNLGHYPAVKLAEARVKFNEASNVVARGEDPAALIDEPQEAKKPTDDLTVRRFTNDFLKWAELKYDPAWYKINKYVADAHLLPLLGERNITEVTRRDAIAFIEEVQANGTGAARNAHKVARAVFDYALQREYIQGTPFIKLAKAAPAVASVERARVLNEEEIQYVWKAIDAGPGDPFTKRALKLILVTAQRPGEVVGMHGSEIKDGWWTISGSRTKKGNTPRVYLTSLAKELIGEYDENGYVFTAPYSGTDKVISTGALSRLVAQEITRARTSKQRYYGIPRWTPHDLRRTARTQMAKLRIPREHAEAVLNHAKEGMIKVYDVYEYEEEKKDALLKWEAELLKLIG